MATVVNVRQSVETQLLLLTGAQASLTRPYRRDQRITAGQTWASVTGVVAGYRYQSNISYVVGSFEVTMVHSLLDPADEEAYIQLGTMIVDQGVLMGHVFWHQDTLTGSYEREREPELTPPERIGNVIEYTVTCQMSITP